MLGFLSRRHRPPARPRVTLGLECLETRDAPAVGLTIDVIYHGGKEITLFGTLSGTEAVAGQMVLITGQAEGTTITDAVGQYCIDLTAAGLGDVTGMCDGETATLTLADPVPYIFEFIASEKAQDVWVFKGKVDHPHPEGLVVQFGGVPGLEGQTATVNADGGFLLPIMLDARGTAWARVVTPWGMESDIAYAEVFQTVG